MRHSLLALLVLSVSSVNSAEVYSGEPLGEALYDLSGASVPVAHAMASASALKRVEVFRLADGRLLAVSAAAERVGKPFTITALRVTPDSKTLLSENSPTIQSVDIGTGK